MRYAITATVLTYEHDEKNVRAWRGSRQVPTFYLDGDVQGIVDEGHAVRIARQVVDPLGALNVVITAAEVPDGS